MIVLLLQLSLILAKYNTKSWLYIEPHIVLSWASGDCESRYIPPTNNDKRAPV